MKRQKNCLSKKYKENFSMFHCKVTFRKKSFKMYYFYLRKKKYRNGQNKILENTTYFQE